MRQSRPGGGAFVRCAMGVDDDEFEQAGDTTNDFVAAVLARSVEEAERFRALLEDHDIPAIIDDVEEVAEDGKEAPVRHGQMAQGISVLVPETLLDEASEVIADVEHLGEFDLTKEEEDEDDSDELGYADGFSPSLPGEDDEELFGEFDDDEEDF